MAFFIVSAWSYAVVWYVFLTEIGLKWLEKGSKMGDLDRCYVCIFRMFRLKKICAFSDVLIEKNCESIFYIYFCIWIYWYLFIWPHSSDCSHTLSNLHFFERFFAKICGEMAFFSSFLQGVVRSFDMCFRLKTGWKVTRKWLEMGVLLGATLCHIAIICWYHAFSIFYNCRWQWQWQWQLPCMHSRQMRPKSIYLYIHI